MEVEVCGFEVSSHQLFINYKGKNYIFTVGKPGT